jgi:hypothetical protein
MGQPQPVRSAHQLLDRLAFRHQLDWPVNSLEDVPRQARVSRRRFLQTAAASALAGPLILTASSRAAAGDRINLGFIGVGTTVCGR